jgi:hypothetical protein
MCEEAQPRHLRERASAWLHPSPVMLRAKRATLRPQFNSSGQMIVSPPGNMCNATHCSRCVESTRKTGRASLWRAKRAQPVRMWGLGVALDLLPREHTAGRYHGSPPTVHTCCPSCPGSGDAVAWSQTIVSGALSPEVPEVS